MPARLLAAGLALATVTGCASGGFFQAPPRPVGGDPWVLPAGSYPSQRLYRVKYHGPEGKAGFKLTLYLGSADHYRMVASDPLGRKLWSLEIDPQDRALWLDHRDKRFCRSSAAGRLRLVPMPHLPLAALPRILLGRLPAEPAANLYVDAAQVSFLDQRGQRWSGVLDGEELQWWILSEGDETLLWWRREDRGGAFSDHDGSQQVSWQELVSEPLGDPLAPLEVPPSFAEADCAGAAENALSGPSHRRLPAATMTACSTSCQRAARGLRRSPCRTAKRASARCSPGCCCSPASCRWSAAG